MPLLSQAATTIEGDWVNRHYMPDDGTFSGKFEYWYVISEDSIDQIVTLGHHFIKSKFIITHKDQLKYTVQEPVSKTEMVFQFNENKDNTLEICMSEVLCENFAKDKLPSFYLEELPEPKIKLTSKWCIDDSCFTQEHNEFQSSYLINLNEGIIPSSILFLPPKDFSNLAGKDWRLYVVSYRMKNIRNDLSSYASQFYLRKAATGASRETDVDMSKITTLTEGAIYKTQIIDDQKTITIEFILRTDFDGSPKHN